MLCTVGLLALFFFSAFTPPQSVLSAEIVPLPIKIVASFFQPESGVPARKTRPFYKHPDASLDDALDAVAWAVKREDVRACANLPSHEQSSDLLTLCVASVQNDHSRCARIGSDSLQTLCHEVVAL